jgi:hypothetical protein
MLQPLPRLLWELGSKHSDTSLLALRMLHDAARYARPDGPISAALQELQAQMAPLYISTLGPGPVHAVSSKSQHRASRSGPGRGGEQGTNQEAGGSRTAKALGKGLVTSERDQNGGRLLVGPLARLPQQCQVSHINEGRFTSS